MQTPIVRPGANLLTWLGVRGDLWISPHQPLSWERLEDSRGHSRHDPEQHEGGNEARHQRQHAAYADRSRPHL
jgi:hypothetical protein